jgi:alkaline phosphatase D
LGCKQNKKKQVVLSENKVEEIVIAFGSCNNQRLENKLWGPILENKPSVWIWGGDVIYSDTDDMALMSEHYEQQMLQDNYSKLRTKAKVLGTWDDHDYGLNDGGLEFVAKAESQQLFLDFLGVSKEDERRKREGVYHSEIVETEKGSVNIIILDTRYFRSALTASPNPEFRYTPNANDEGTILGDVQWAWLTNELNASKADFNLIISSIQFLSSEHGYESWGNMPHEVDRLKKMIGSSNAKGVILLSGDRHISEFSKTTVENISYPLIDFTSSGMTHSYSSYDGEPNKYREGEVVSNLSFGLLKIDFETKTVVMQMRGENNVLQQELIHVY